MNEYLNRSKAERESALHSKAQFNNDQTNKQTTNQNTRNGFAFVIKGKQNQMFLGQTHAKADALGVSNDTNYAKC
jgi:hypothetical protein